MAMWKNLELFKQDDLMRLIYAFRTYFIDNPYWILESEHTRQNRKITKRILGEELADYYFFQGKHFYAFSMERENDIILCWMREYETFYDFTNHYLEISFSYHIPSQQIICVGKLKEGEEIKKEKIKKP